MKFLRIIAFTLIALIFESPAYSSLIVGGDWVTFDGEEALQSDLYVFSAGSDITRDISGDLIALGRKVDAESKVDGNLYSAAQSIHIAGEVSGDIWGFAQDIDISGRGNSGFRGACAELNLKGEITGDVVVFAGVVRIAKNAVVNGNLYIGAGTLDVEGTVNGNVKGEVETFKLSGKILQDIDLKVRNIELDSTGIIEGNLIYENFSPANYNLEPQVLGKVYFHKAEEKLAPPFKWMFRLWGFLASLITGFILVAVFKSHLNEALEKFRQKPGITLLIGFLGFIAFPIVAIIAIITLFALPVGLIIGAIYGIMLYLGLIIAGIILGYFTLKLLRTIEPSLYLATLIGTIILCLLKLIPVLGSIIALAGLLFGLGLLLVGTYYVIWGNR